MFFAAFIFTLIWRLLFTSARSFSRPGLRSAFPLSFSGVDSRSIWLKDCIFSKSVHQKYVSFSNISYSVRAILRLKRIVACNQLIGCDSQHPKINALVITASIVDLRREIKMGSNDGKHISPVLLQI